MPRTSQKQREKSYANVAKNIRTLLTMSERSNRDLCAYLGFTGYVTYQRRMENPALFTLDELYRIANYFNVAPQTLIFGCASILSIGSNDTNL